MPRRSASHRSRTWMVFALLLVGALAAIPVGAHLANVAAGGDAPAPAPRRADPPQATPSAAPASWRTFEATDGSFSILGPTDPQVRELSTDLGPAHEATFAQGNLSVAWTDRSGGSSDADALGSEVSKILGPLRGMTVDEERLRDGAAPGFGLSFDAQGTHYRLRIFADGGRLFEIVATGPQGSAQAKLGNAFVSSFRLA